MTYEIETGIEIPEVKRLGRKAKYPWEILEIGESFFITDPPRNRFGVVCAGYASTASKKYAPKKYTQRSVDGGLRIWRIE